MDETKLEPEEARAETAVPVMENVTRMDRDRYFEAARVRGKSWKSRIFAALSVVCAMLGLMMTNLAVFVVGMIAALLAMFSHVILAYRDFGKLKRFHPTGEWTKTVRFFEDHIETDSGVGVTSVAKYRDIKREYETEHMYVIDFGGKVPATTLSKDGFVSGSFEEMKQFLLERQRAEYDTKK